MIAEKQFTTRELATLLGVKTWQVRRLFESKELPEPARFAGKRVLTGQEIPAIVDGLRRRGWLPMLPECEGSASV